MLRKVWNGLRSLRSAVCEYDEGCKQLCVPDHCDRVPSTADEAKALIPSLEKKVEDGTVQEADLEALCLELNKIKRQTQL